jgi:hypothetical protein
MNLHQHKQIRLLLLAALVLWMGCGGWHRYDKSEEPVVEVSRGLRPVISWMPNTAFTLHVYEGAEQADSDLDAIWSANGGGGWANALHAPVTYGIPPEGSFVREAPPLEAGKTYTVVIRRKDPKGSGSGFTATGHRYEGTKTFVAQSN